MASTDKKDRKANHSRKNPHSAELKTEKNRERNAARGKQVFDPLTKTYRRADGFAGMAEDKEYQKSALDLYNAFEGTSPAVGE